MGYEVYCIKCDHRMDYGLCEEAACPCVCRVRELEREER